MAFIRKGDYLTQIQTDDLDTITETNDLLLNECERIAIEEITSYIQHRYDVEQIFQTIPQWLNVNYEIDDIVYFLDNNLTYKSKTQHVGASESNPSNDPTNWELIIDPRNAKIVMCCVDLSLYHLHSRINPRNIPELRGVRRDDCVAWLEGVRDQKNNPTLPNLEDENGNTVGTTINWGSQTLNNNRF